MKQEMRVVSAAIALLCGVVPAQGSGFATVYSKPYPGEIYTTDFFRTNRVRGADLLADEVRAGDFLFEDNQEGTDKHGDMKGKGRKQRWVAYAGQNDIDGSRQIILGRYNEDGSFVEYAAAPYSSGNNAGQVWHLKGLVISYDNGRDDELFIIVVGQPNNEGTEISIYRFNKSDRTLLPTLAKSTFNEGQIFWVRHKKVAGKHFIFVSGDNKTGGKEVTVYEFNPAGGCSLTEFDFAAFPQREARSIDTKRINDTIYAAAVGIQDDVSIPNAIKIYSFDSITGLTLLLTQTFGGDQPYCCEWTKLNGEWYLAVGGDNTSANEQQIKLYKFNPLIPTLLPVVTATIDFGSGVVYEIESGKIACNNQRVLLACGMDGAGGGNAELRAYLFDGTNLTLIDTFPALSSDGVIYGVDGITIQGDYFVAIGNNDPAHNATQIQILNYVPSCPI